MDELPPLNNVTDQSITHLHSSSSRSSNSSVGISADAAAAARRPRDRQADSHAVDRWASANDNMERLLVTGSSTLAERLENIQRVLDRTSSSVP